MTHILRRIIGLKGNDAFLETQLITILIHLNNSQQVSSYLIENTLCLHYKAKLVHSVDGYSRFYAEKNVEPKNKLCRLTSGYLILTQLVYIVTTVFKGLKELND
jgi:hypothetical protein